MFSKFTPHNVNSFPEPCVRLSRTQLFIITFTVTVTRRGLHISSDMPAGSILASPGIPPNCNFSFGFFDSSFHTTGSLHSNDTLSALVCCMSLHSISNGRLVSDSAFPWFLLPAYSDGPSATSSALLSSFEISFRSSLLLPRTFLSGFLHNRM